MTQNEEFYHYGVKGMKWGVRKRYEGKGGTYTRKGVDKFYDRLHEYELSKDKLKSLKGQTDRSAIKTAKITVRSNKQKLNKQYKQLRFDKMADSGKELRAKGYAINDITRRASIRSGVISIGGTATANILAQHGMTRAAGYAVVGFNFVSGILYASDTDKIRKLRAYYAH